MSKIEINNLAKLMILSYPIGYGDSGICFRNYHNQVIKIFFSKEFANFVKNNLTSLINKGNDTFITPDTSIIKDNRFIGYVYPYIKGKTLQSMPTSTHIIFYINGYNHLVEKTKDFSEHKFILGDIHPKNIIFDGHFHIIDLDKGNFMHNKTCEEVFKYNICLINKSIIDSIFKVKIYELLTFDDAKLQKLYSTASYQDYHAMIELFNEFQVLYGEDTTINTLKQKIPHKIKYNTYFRW